MSDQGLNEKMINLATRYLSGNTNSEEIRELEAWVLAKPDNKRQFIALKKAWMLTGIEQNDQAIDVDKLWEQTSDQLFSKDEKEESETVFLRPPWLRYAASFAILIIAAFLIWQFIARDNTMIVKATDSSKSFELYDGSRVKLNQASSLTFAVDKDKRKAILSGNAFFDVERDEDIPFVIQTQNIEIEVLGTSFYVDSREDELEIQVIVQSGSVAVRYGSQETILSADEKAVFQKEGRRLVKQENDDPNYLSLKTNVLDFENSRLSDVIFAINRQFNSDISLDIKDFSNCEITAIFDNKTLEAIITVIEKTLGIEAVEQGGEIVLSGDKCN